MEKLILITGKIGSGKTTLANALENKLISNGFYVFRTGFSLPLKRMLYFYFKITKEGIFYKKHTEKEIDLYLKMFFDYLDDEQYKYIKDLVYKYYFSEENKKEIARKLLQYIGTEVFRYKDENYWVKKTIVKINNIKSYVDYVIIDDWRFPNEDLSSEFNTLRIKLDVPQYIREKRVGYRLDDSHLSEQFIDMLNYDLKFTELDEIQEMVNKILKYLGE